MNIASHHLDTGHYAAQHINNVASKLDQVFKLHSPSALGGPHALKTVI